MIEQENFFLSYPFNSKSIRPRKRLEASKMALSSRSIDEAVSQQHRDIVDNKYQELRRPRKIFFYRNGDRYFKGKQLYITPHRYLSFDELLVDLTKSVSLPYGVRKVYTQDGVLIRDIEDLKDGGTYVCASFERFKKLKYGKYNNPGFAVPKVRPRYESHLYNTFPPTGSSQHFSQARGGFIYPSHGKYAAAYGKTAGTFGQGHAGPGSFQYSGGRPGASLKPVSKTVGIIHSDVSPVKPRIVKIVKNGERPRKTVSLLLNKRSVQSFEHLVLDISDALGLPKYKNNRIRKLYNLKGREIRGLVDFFREDEVFIASSSKHPLSDEDIADIYEELYPNNPYAQKYPKKGTKDRESKTDSGFGDDEEKAEQERILRKKENAKKLEKERDKAKKEERLKAAKWEKQRREEEEDEEFLDDEMQRMRDENEWRMQQELERERINKEKEAELERKERELKKMEQELQRKLENNQKQKEAELLAALAAREAEIQAREKELKEEEERRKAERKKQEKEDEERKKAEKKRREEEEERRKKEEERRKKEEEDRQKKKEEEERRKMEEEKRKREEAERQKAEEERQKAEEERRKAEEERRRKEEDERKKEEKIRKDEENAAEEKRKQEEAEKQKTDNENEKDKFAKGKGDQNKKGGKKKKKDQDNKYASDPRAIKKRDDIEKRYKIGKKIGDGNFADVHVAELINTDQEFAMKIVDKSKLKGKEQMIENEIGIMKNVKHANIVRLFEEHETKENIFLVMEYVKGGDLFDAITESVKFTEANAALMVSDLSNALDYLHGLNIVHRDLKPENLLVSNDPSGDMVLKLADFGLAMEVKEPIFTVCGTPTYVAPEILAETGYGLEVDMWATGVITYILLCGFPPFRSLDRDQEELFEIIQAGEFEYLSPYWDNISDSAKDLINHLLVVDKRKRYTAKQVLEHTWIVNEGPSRNRLNLQREITMNLEKNFGKGKNHQVGVET
ncbi:serine/threonine-protein kinase DCLK1-like isoform X2 [Anneissia japonica]|uniref:serine/threonine-protein kinase DCLK1-like isoform X2 n=1 Tax=Anneissia japonica TaxID=1529436 RepID=UPI0014257A20|nr:serine/threonine-protein kinase DCLK1-like isoform X2 [Anneissia japonica]